MALTRSGEKGKKPSHSKDSSSGSVRKGRLSQFFEDLTNKMANKKSAKTKSANPKEKNEKAPAAIKLKKPASKVADSDSEVPSPVTPVAVVADVELNVESLENEEVVLTDAEGRRYCRATDCDQIGLVDGYCRYHYLYFWKKIQVRKRILADGKLERYIEELTARYTDKFIELLRKDLRTEKDFLAAVQELELDDSSSGSQQDEDEAKNYLEEISGVASDSSSRDDDNY